MMDVKDAALQEVELRHNDFMVSYLPHKYGEGSGGSKGGATEGTWNVQLE